MNTWVVVVIVIAVGWLLYSRKSENLVSMNEAKSVAKDVVKRGGTYIDFVARIGTSEISPLQFTKLVESR